jgi:predicted Zn-dependent peptidase
MYNKTELRNGVRIITEKLDQFRSVSLGIWVGAGSRDENEKNSGTSHFIEHMIFKGTKRRDCFSIARELDAVGGLSNAFTGKEYTCFHSKVLNRHFPVLAEILSDIFLNSSFSPEEIDRERQVILQEIGMVEDSPEEYIHELFNNLIYRNHPLGLSILGTSESISSIDRPAMLAHMRRYYRPERIIISAAGDLEHDKIVEYFKPLFEIIEPADRLAEAASPVPESGIQCVYKDLEQTQVVLGGTAPSILDRLRYAGTLFNTILGGNMSSRLFQEVREKRGLAYSIYSFISAHMDTGTMGVCFATEAQQVNEVLKVVVDEIVKIQNGDISEAELDAAKEHLIGGILIGSENTDARMMRLAKNEFFFKRCIDYDELIADLQKVTREEIIKCCNDAFSPDKLTVTTLGPFREDDMDVDWSPLSNRVEDN